MEFLKTIGLFLAIIIIICLLGMGAICVVGGLLWTIWTGDWIGWQLFFTGLISVVLGSLSAILLEEL